MPDAADDRGVSSASLDSSGGAVVTLLLVILIVRLSQATRADGDDPLSFADPETLFAGDGPDWWPSLTGFAFFHAVNLSVLTAAFALLAVTEGQTVRLTLSTVVALVGLAVPALELGLYETIRRTNVPPLSLAANAVTVASLAVLVWHPAYGLAEPLRLAAAGAAWSTVASAGAVQWLTLAPLAAAVGAALATLTLIQWELEATVGRLHGTLAAHTEGGDETEGWLHRRWRRLADD